MARTYLRDVEFLKALDEMRIKEHFISLQIMNMQEKPIKFIQGIATAGNITVNGSSAVRRTINLTLSVSSDNNDITNLNNFISCDKKVNVELGIKNPFNDYKFYGDIIWFPLGVYCITEANAQTSATNATVTIKGKDKMCKLDGSCGGTLPATVTFHEAQTINANGEVTVEKIPIFTIIKECVKHYGQELEENIIINDLDLTAKQSMKYVGSSPIWFDDDFKLSPIISDTMPEDNSRLNKYILGQEIGYIETDFTFPGELVFEAGEPITAVLDKIIQTIGNYEYFYDLDGHFVFQEKKNYLNHYYTPIIDLRDGYYIRNFSDSKYYTTFQDSKDVMSYMNNPKYENIKNDYVVWGKSTTSDGVTRNIQYHVAIDEKPIIDLANKKMWEKTDGNGEHISYFAEYETEEFVNTPNGELIELVVDISLSKEQIRNKIIAHLNTLYMDNYTEKSFIVYVKIIQDNSIYYYRSKIQDGKVNESETFELYYYEDSIKVEYLTIGILEPLEEEKEEDNVINENEELKNYLQAMVDNKKDFLQASIDFFDKDNPSSWLDNWGPLKEYQSTHNELLNSIKDTIKKISFSENLLVKEITFKEFCTDKNYKDIEDSDALYKAIIYSSSEETGKEKNWNSYIALEFIKQDEKYQLGYYNKENVWINLYELNNLEELTYKSLPKILSSIKNQGYEVRIYYKDDFNKDNKYDFSFIFSNNLISQEQGDLQSLLTSGNSTEKILLKYQFEDVKLNIEQAINTFLSDNKDKISFVEDKDEEKFKDKAIKYDWTKENAINSFSQWVEEELSIKLTEDQKTSLNGKIQNSVLSAENVKNMIKELVKPYKKNPINFTVDLTTIWSNLEKDDKGSYTGLIKFPNGSVMEGNESKLDEIFNSSDSEPSTNVVQSQTQSSINSFFESLQNIILGQSDFSSSNNTPNQSTQTQTPSQNESEEDKINKLIQTLKTFTSEDKNLIKTIIEYASTGKTAKNLLEEFAKYWTNVILSDDVDEKYLLEVITLYPENPVLDYSENIQYKLIGEKCGEWREELYRQALLNKDSAGAQGYYDEELIAFWPENFDTTNEEWKREWRNYLGLTEQDIEINNPDKIVEINSYYELYGWNPAIYKDPGLLKYWLDFIDSDQLITQFSVNRIGRRTKSISKENIKNLYRLEVPDVIFIENKNIEDNKLASLIQEYNDYGQKYCLLKPNEMKNFTSSTIGSTAFDLIREMLFTNLSYQTSISITCIPKYYLEPNNLIYVSDKNSNIQGDFFITQLNIPLTYNGTMSISASQTTNRL